MSSSARRWPGLASVTAAVAASLALLALPATASQAEAEAAELLAMFAPAGDQHGDEAATSAAQAPGTCYSDAIGDVHELESGEPADEPRADITQLCVEYGDTLALSVQVMEPTDPRTDPAWIGATFVAWYVDVTGDHLGEYFVAYRLNEHSVFVADVWDIRSPEDVRFACAGTPLYEGGVYTASGINPGCIGSPDTVRIQAGVFYDVSGNGDGPVYHDVAPGAAYTPPVGQGICTDPVPAPFSDRASIAAVHVRNVDCLWELGIARGTEVDGRVYYNPVADVTRAQFAGFTHRTLLVGGSGNPPMGPGFSDVPTGHTFEEQIRRLAGGGILEGYAGTDRFGPADPVRRDQTASILVRAAEFAWGTTLSAQGGGYFADTAGNTHATNIDIAFEQGFVNGLTAPASGQPGQYGPAGHTTRQQMASVLVRYLQALK